MAGDRTFLVERYLPRLRPADVEPLARRLAAAAGEMQREGRDVRWLRSVAIPDDETCLCSFSAPTRMEVEEVNRRAGAAYERILDAVAIEAGAQAG